MFKALLWNIICSLLTVRKSYYSHFRIFFLPSQLKWVVRGTNSAASAIADNNSSSSHSPSDTLASAVVPVQEDLVSVSTDGLVLQWSLKKGFTVATLMKLKRGALSVRSDCSAVQ